MYLEVGIEVVLAEEVNFISLPNSLLCSSSTSARSLVVNSSGGGGGPPSLRNSSPTSSTSLFTPESPFPPPFRWPESPSEAFGNLEFPAADKWL